MMNASSLMLLCCWLVLFRLTSFWLPLINLDIYKSQLMIFKLDGYWIRRSVLLSIPNDTSVS